MKQANTLLLENTVPLKSPCVVFIILEYLRTISIIIPTMV